MATFNTPVFSLVEQANQILPAVNYQVVLLNDAINSITIASGNVSGTIITSNGHGFVNGQAVLTNANLGANWSANTARYVVGATVNTFQVASIPGGTAIALTGATATIRDLPLVNPLHLDPPQAAIAGYRAPGSKEAILVKEIANYDGLVARPEVGVQTAASFATYDHDEARVTLRFNDADLDNTGGSITISYNAIAILSGGLTTPGNTTGTVKSVVAFVNNQTIGQDVARILRYTYRLSGR